MCRPATNTPRTRLFAPTSFLESSRTADVLRAETVGGVLLLVGAAVALVWANSPWSSTYDDLRDLQVGPHFLHLDLTLGQWAADGLLAIFFFVAGLELKREFVAGELRDPRRAALPVAAAVGGMICRRCSTSRGTRQRHAARLGDPHRHRHRVRGRGARGDQLAPAQRAAHVPAHPGGGRRPAGDHRDRARLHRRTCSPLYLLLAALPLAAFAALAHTRHADGVPPDPLRARHLGAGARLGSARDRGGRAARVRRPGTPTPRRRPRSRDRRAHRAPHPAGVRGVRGAGVRVLRRWRDRRWAGRVHRRALGPRRAGHRHRTDRRQVRRGRRLDLAGGEVHRSRARRGPGLGRRRADSPCLPGSASPCRC